MAQGGFLKKKDSSKYRKYMHGGKATSLEAEKPHCPSLDDLQVCQTVEE